MVDTFVTINACIFVLLAAVRPGYLVKIYAGNKVLREQAMRLERDVLFNAFKGPGIVFTISLSWIISNFI
jgi:hypothetical protein